MSDETHLDDTQGFEPTRALPTAQQEALRNHPPRRMARRSNPFLLPLWSIALMFVAVMGASAGVVLLVYLLGTNQATPAEPVFQIVTAPPTETSQASALPSVTPDTGPITGVAMPLPTFELEGPTLEPVFLSPTPDFIEVGKVVQVINVGENGLNVRSAPGIRNELRHTAPEGSTHLVEDGPEEADGFTWWLIRNEFTGELGWAAATYLDVFSQGQS